MTAPRFLWLVRKLQRWRTRKQLAAWLRVTTREVSRDLVALERMGFRLEFRQSSHNRRHWRIRDAQKTLLRITKP